MEIISNKIDDIFNNINVVPLLSLDNLDDSIGIARALVNGGLNVLEVALRTNYSLQAIKELKAAVPEAYIGAGTVTTPAQFDNAVNANADFIFTPGVTEGLLKAAIQSNTPTIPGISTISEAMYANDFGFNQLKLFPAETLGGIDFLKAVYGPFPGLKFCPTGGVNFDKASKYLSLKNVFCIAGSWVTPKELVKLKKWKEIERLASEASSLHS